MGCNKSCCNCGSTDNVRYNDTQKEFFCEDCWEMNGK